MIKEIRYGQREVLMINHLYAKIHKLVYIIQGKDEDESNRGKKGFGGVKEAIIRIIDRKGPKTQDEFLNIIQGEFFEQSVNLESADLRKIKSAINTNLKVNTPNPFIEITKGEYKGMWDLKKNRRKKNS